mgnify:CR=1 FL=1
MILNPVPWPNRARVACAITFDMDADSLVHLEHPKDSIRRVSTISMLRYGPEVGVPRILTLLEEHAIRATSLPEDQWKTFKGLSKDKLNVLYCYTEVCHLAARAAVLFAGAGYPVMEMEGGFKAWKENELETVKGGGQEDVGKTTYATGSEVGGDEMAA